MDAHIIGAPSPRYRAEVVPHTDPVTHCVRDGVYDGEHNLEAIVCYASAEHAATIAQALNLLDATRQGRTATYPVSLVVSVAIAQSSRLS